eukprot:4293543-Pyramimonas_sp.AAC.1
MFGAGCRILQGIAICVSPTSAMHYFAHVCRGGAESFIPRPTVFSSRTEHMTTLMDPSSVLRGSNFP